MTARRTITIEGGEAAVKILALETSAKSVSAAVAEGGVPLA